ncbi:MAG: hypothetical protein EXS16_06955 [Gemmataceae bacterium]|nr:hypothetical protein [Gemmataceae bacterium]
MNFFTRILAIDVPENTTFVWPPDFSFRGLSTGWALFVFALVLLGSLAVGFFYLLEKGTLGIIRRVFLIGLRISILFLLLFLILRPVIVAEFEGKRPRGVAFVLDASQSMDQRDRRLTDSDKARVAIAMGKLPLDTKIGEKISGIPGDLPKDPSRRDIVKAILEHKDLALTTKIEKKLGPLRAHLFATDYRGIDDATRDTKKPWVEKIIADYDSKEMRERLDISRTALADTIMKLMQTKESDLPGAIVVVTDGQDNASKYTLQEAAAECVRAGVPLHIYGVGSTEAGQLNLKEVGVPDTLFTEDTVSVPLRWRAQGVKVGDLEITMTLDGKKIAEKKLRLAAGEDLRDALNFVVPKDLDKRENHEIVTTIRVKGQDLVDTVKNTVRINEQKIKILYIEHSPRWEYKFLQPALLRDRRVEAEFILVNAVPEVAKGGKPFLAEFPKTKEKFFESMYNLVIIGDVDANYFTKDQQEWIREFVQKRGGLIVLAGRQNMPATYENTPLAEVLPVEFAKQKFGLDSETRTQEYMPTLSEAGLRTDWLALGDTPEENAEVWQKKLIGFHWQFPITKLRPGATSLIINPRAKMGDQAMPVLATQYYGKGQVLWLGTDETWRWRWNYQDKYFVRFWGQLVYQTGLPSLLGDGAKRANMAMDRSQTVLGTNSKIFVRLLEKDFTGRKDDRVTAELEYIDAKPGEERRRKIELRRLPGPNGEYVASLFNDRAGRIQLKVMNPEDNVFSFRVDLPAKHELEESGLAEKTLSDAAELSGGKFYREENLREMSENLQLKTTTFRRRQEILLWNPLAILLFLGLITTEWIVRKFSDLS